VDDLRLFAVEEETCLIALRALEQREGQQEAEEGLTCESQLSQLFDTQEPVKPENYVDDDFHAEEEKEPEVDLRDAPRLSQDKYDLDVHLAVVYGVAFLEYRATGEQLRLRDPDPGCIWRQGYQDQPYGKEAFVVQYQATTGQHFDYLLGNALFAVRAHRKNAGPDFEARLCPEHKRNILLYDVGGATTWRSMQETNPSRTALGVILPFDACARMA
jgi:hypothetical protein